jgi:hypothetical protein
MFSRFPPLAWSKSATSENTSQSSYYDAAGNVSYDGTNFYAYDGEGRQCAVYDALSSSMTAYVYNAEGLRVAKGTVTGLTAPTVNQMMIAAQDCNLATLSNFTPRAQYLLDQGGNQVTELSGSGSNLAWVHTNIWVGGTLDATYTAPSGSNPGGLHFHLKDPLGTRRVQRKRLMFPPWTCICRIATMETWKRARCAYGVLSQRSGGLWS